MITRLGVAHTEKETLSLLRSCKTWTRSTRLGVDNGYLMLGMRRWIQSPGIGIKTSDNELLVQALTTLVACAKPDFRFTSIYINKNFSGVLHSDKGNDGDSVMYSLGDFTGGDLWIYPYNRHPTKDTWLQFDGKYPHCTYPYEGPDRFSIIFFTHEAYEEATDQMKAELESYGFSLPTHMVKQPSICSISKAAKLLPPELKCRIPLPRPTKSAVVKCPNDKPRPSPHMASDPVTRGGPDPHLVETK